jgi:endonuclease/exonuclease/phosphatase family metal-dependent hydrolase
MKLSHTPSLRTALAAFVFLGASFLFAGAEPPQNTVRVRVASYNIQYLSAAQLPNQGDRAEKLKQLITKLDADIIGLQEIDDRAALELIFDKERWQLLIDDDSPEAQDLAVAVRKPFVLASRPDLDADDADFLFPGPDFETLFRARRDVLVAKVVIPGQLEPLNVMVVHQKSRLGGRATTDPTREDAARLLVKKLESEYDGKRFVLLGDFNDNADDRSLNILETGDPEAVGKIENEDGPFLFNPSEALLEQELVTHGKRESDIVTETGRIQLTAPGSRQRNDAARGTDVHTGPILFDQILIPMTIRSAYRANSIRIFDEAIALNGTGSGKTSSRASDHLPISLELELTGSIPDVESDPTDLVKISALLADPFGADAGKETVTLQNLRTTPVSLDRWSLKDRGGNSFVLTGSLEGRATLTISLPSGKLPLNNAGDEVKLLDADGITVHRVRYQKGAVTEGSELRFP